VTYKLSNVSYNASVISYDSSTVSLLQSLMAEIGGVQIAGKGWSQLGTHSISSAAGGAPVAQTISLPVRTRSTIALVHLMRDGTDITSEAKASISTRRTRAISQFQHSIGGVRYPIRPVANLSETNPAGAYVQLQKAFYTVTGQHRGGILSLGTTGSDVGAVGTYNFYAAANGCSFMIVQGFESSPGDQNIQSGLDLSNQSQNVQLEMTMTPSASNSTQVDSYAYADSLFTFTSSGVIIASR
jgi:hypothetical protein